MIAGCIAWNILISPVRQHTYRRIISTADDCHFDLVSLSSFCHLCERDRESGGGIVSMYPRCMTALMPPGHYWPLCCPAGTYPRSSRDGYILDCSVCNLYSVCRCLSCVSRIWAECVSNCIRYRVLRRSGYPGTARLGPAGLACRPRYPARLQPTPSRCLKTASPRPVGAASG